MSNKTIITLLVVCIVMAIMSPLAWIWSLNTIFQTGIPFTLKTWCASHILTAPIYYLAFKY